MPTTTLRTTLSPPSTLSTLFFLTLLAAGARPASAQGAVIIRSDGVGPVVTTPNVIVQRLLPISDDTVRSLIERFEPGVLTDDADANVVTIVIDHDGGYVRSTARTAKVMQPQAGQVIAIGPDSVRAFVVPRTSDGGPAMIGGGGAVTISSFKRADGAGDSYNVLGTGFSADEIDAMSTKHYPAGTLAKGQLVVTVLRLK